MPTDLRPPVAIVHDYLTQRGGAERVVLELARTFPEASIHTSLYAPKATFPEFSALDIRPMALNRIGVLQSHHRLGLPLFA
ncbi:MAG: glycosyltransferase family 4 protein, partial [Actinomycetota bacterium]